MKKIFLQLLMKIFLITVFFISCQSLTAKEIVISKVSSPITIDGDSSEWSNFPAYTLNEYNQSAEISAYFKMCYDNDYIYVLVAVTDPTPNKEGYSTWQSDCVELYFAMDITDSWAYREGDWQIRKVAAHAQDDFGIDGMGNRIDVLLNDDNFKVEQKDGIPYVQEWKLPINTLVGISAFDGENFRFDIAVADNNGIDGYRSGHIFWNSAADNQWTTIQNQGFVKLSQRISSDNITIDSNSVIINMNKYGIYYIDSISYLFDSGGELQYYDNNENYRVTIYPKDSTKYLRAVIKNFSVESGFDYLRVYDGPNTNARLIGEYTGYLNNEIEFSATNPYGALTFVFQSDGIVVYEGFKIMLYPETKIFNPHLLNLKCYDTLSKIVFVKNYNSWEVKENANWIELNKTSGSGLDTIIIHTSINQSLSDRMGYLEFTLTDSTGKSELINYVIRQEKNIPYVLSSIDTIYVSYRGSKNIKVPISSNTEWYVNSSYSDWLQLHNNYWNYGNDSISFSVTPNQLLAPRGGSISISWYDNINYFYREILIVVIQEGASNGVMSDFILVNANDTVTSLTLKSKNSIWTLSAKDSWVSLPQPSGVDSFINLPIIIEQNPEARRRYTEIRILFNDTLTNDTDSVKVTLMQFSNLPWLHLPDTIYVSENNSNILINVESNAFWTIYNTYYDWIIVENGYYNYFGNQAVNVKISRNPLYLNRTGYLTFYYYSEDGWTSYNKKVYIKQNGSAFGVSSTRINLSSNNNSEALLKVKADNVAWNLYSDADWLTCTPMSWIGDRDVVIKANQNSSIYERSAIIYLKAFEGTSDEISIPILVTQAGQEPHIEVSKNSISLVYGGAPQTISLIANCSWYIEYPSWVVCDPSSGFGNQTINIYSQNQGNFSGYIYIYDWDSYKLHQTIRVNQISSGGSNLTQCLSIYKTSNRITIDGKVDSSEVWNKITEVPLSKKTNNTSGISGVFKMCYDDEFVYVLSKVSDQTPLSILDSYSYQNDGIDLYFSMDKNNHVDYLEGDWKIRKIAALNDIDGIIGTSGLSDNNFDLSVLKADPSFNFAQTNNGNSYTVEFAIPLSTLIQNANFDGQNFRFDVLVDDYNSFGYLGTIAWNSLNNNQTSSTEYFGCVKMAGFVSLPSIDNLISIYPNPLTDKLFIQSNAQLIQNVTLTNIEGKVLYKLSDINNGYVIDMSRFKPGVYVLKLQTTNGIVTKQIIKK